VQEQVMRIVVVGGSGRIGAQVAAILRHRGHDVVAASRRSGVDSVTGEGVAAAVAGARVVIDVTNADSFESETAVEFFRASSRTLLAAERQARVRHHIALSIVGTDRMLDSPYFRAKMTQEALIAASPIPHTILRSTQFFDFMTRIGQSDRATDSVHVSPAYAQPVAAAEVAAALADLATAEPRNDMIEHAGPELLRLDEVVRRVMEAQNDPREVTTDPHARYFGALLRNDTLIADEGAIIGVTRFDHWLHTRPRDTLAEPT
jgi:uncharacterized protein YbjT (DUF2867 family)